MKTFLTKEQKSLKLHNKICEALASYLTFNGWEFSLDESFSYICPLTKLKYSSTQAWHIQNERDLRKLNEKQTKTI